MHAFMLQGRSASDGNGRSVGGRLNLAVMPAAAHGNLAYMLALFLVERGRAEEALNWMEKAAVELPGNSRIRYYQGLLAALRSGLERSPNDPDLLYWLIYLHAVDGERSAAFGYVKRMREAAPDDPRLQVIEPYWQQQQ
ncbi:hypothetical protein [Pseudomonas sp. BN515]|uniref:tetratricopeptide repeat protein n=1 Tax=Pseudomonas sp. BN515 TaxID=2567892 RepID=UPI002456BA4D|nr:hypothetical protein [Pseudomonas sp. BN515]